jgi:hypothetical protein
MPPATCRRKLSYRDADLRRRNSMAETWKRKTKLARAVWRAGFSYSPEQDIIFSRMGAWQRKFGYAYSYDLTAPAIISAVIDCEPFFFKYDQKHWMIELWKGQYGLETGGEIGVYIDRRRNFLDSTLGKRPHDPANGRFFNCANDSELLEMSFSLARRGRELFGRSARKHWWLTGFKWGVLSDPEDLVMSLCIKMPSKKMRQAFVEAVKETGYEDVEVEGTSIRFVFDKPKTYQPRFDPDYTAMVAQAAKNNKKIVSRYRGLQLPNNDPNEIDDDIAEVIIDYFKSHRWSNVKQNLATVLERRPTDILEDLRRHRA